MCIDVLTVSRILEVLRTGDEGQQGGRAILRADQGLHGESEQTNRDSRGHKHNQMVHCRLCRNSNGPRLRLDDHHENVRWYTNLADHLSLLPFLLRDHLLHLHPREESLERDRRHDKNEETQQLQVVAVLRVYGGMCDPPHHHLLPLQEDQNRDLDHEGVSGFRVGGDIGDTGSHRDRGATDHMGDCVDSVGDVCIFPGGVVTG